MMGSAIAAAAVVPQIYAQHLAQKFYASRMETSINTGIADMQMGLPSCSTHKCSYCGRERHKAGHVSCDGCGASHKEKPPVKGASYYAGSGPQPQFFPVQSMKATRTPQVFTWVRRWVKLRGQIYLRTR